MSAEAVPVCTEGKRRKKLFCGPEFSPLASTATSSPLTLERKKFSSAGPFPSLPPASCKGRNLLQTASPPPPPPPPPLRQNHGRGLGAGRTDNVVKRENCSNFFFALSGSRDLISSNSPHACTVQKSKKYFFLLAAHDTVFQIKVDQVL